MAVSTAAGPIERRIDQYFPMKKYRAGQRQTIRSVLEAFRTHKYVLLEAPTGSGKSAVAMTLAQFFGKSYYLAPQKFLQDQLSRDFGPEGVHANRLHEPMVELKGRNAYPCEYYSEAALDPEAFDCGAEDVPGLLKEAGKGPGCDVGECRKKGDSKRDDCLERGICPYWNQLHRAQAASMTLLNFHSFLYQTVYANQFGQRDLMILDEAHNVESVLMGFVGTSVNDRPFLTDGIRFPELGSVAEYLEFFQEVDLLDRIENQRKLARLAENVRDEDEWKSVLERIKKMYTMDPESWICEYREAKDGSSRTLQFKPLFVDRFADDYVFSKANKVLMMSATILSKRTVCEALGIDPQDACFIRLGSTFPPKARPILYRPSGPMSWANKSSTLPKMVKDVNEICRRHAGERGIIHTHTFEIANALLSGCARDVRDRFLYQKDLDFGGDKARLLRAHKASSDSVIVAPAMHEGLDLADDLGRFQVICKVPYPSKGDPQVKARMELSSEYYDWLTATKLVQSYGRIYRSKDDHGITYVLDQNFKWFYRSSERMLPAWFKEVVDWSGGE